MAQIQCRRLFFKLLKNRRPFSSSSSSSVSANPQKETLVSSASLLNNPSSSIPPPPPPPPPPHPSIPPPTDFTDSKAWSFLKCGIFAGLTGAVGTAGYATYKYTLEEVDEKTKSLRESPNKYTVSNDASSLEKFQALLYSTAMTVPAKSAELYLDLRRAIEEHVRGFTEPSADKLLPDMDPGEDRMRAFTLVLDLNETLVYSDWQRDRGWRTFKRPGVDAFLERLSQVYEIVIYSDQLNMYVDPVMERLNMKQPPQPSPIRFALSRSATKYQDGKHYRDLSKLNRDPSRIIYVSGHALESSLQPENSVPVKPWKAEADDTALLDLLPFLEYVGVNRPADIRPVLASYQGHDIPTEFINRSKEYQRWKDQNKKHGSLWRR